MIEKPENRLVSATLMGGLGNRLFAMATAVGYAERTQRRPVICTLYNQTQTQRGHEDYSKSVFSRFSESNSKPNEVFNERSTDAFTYQPLPETDAWHYHLHGYFQDCRYFHHAFQSLKDILVLPSIPQIPKTAFIHIRRKDYLLYDEHNVDLYSRYLPSAIRLVKDRYPPVIFHVYSDDSEWCRWYMSRIERKAVVVEQEDPVKAMCEMAACSVGGICWNSSFSWWAAYLGFKSSKLIIFPDKWYNDPRLRVTVQFPGSIRLSVE
jgi:hypothetical protein